MKRICILLMIAGLLAALCGAAAAESEWEIGSDGTVTAYSGPGGDVTVPAEISGIRVLTVARSTFSGREDITGVTFPEGMLYVGNVLNSCDSLERVTLPPTLQAIDYGFLDYTPKLKEVVIPASLLYIDSGFLTTGDSLERIVFTGLCPVIRDSATVLSGIPEDAVILVPDEETEAYRAALTAVDSDRIQPSGQTAETAPALDLQLVFDEATGTVTDCFSRDIWVEIPPEINGVPVKHIGENAFARCEYLYCAGIPEGVEDIGKNAFGSLSHLGYVSLPDSVQVIGAEAFQSFRGLSVHWPASLREIGDRAFNASKLTGELHLPDSLERIGSEAFRNTTIRQLYLPASLKTIGENAFEGRSLEYIYTDSGVLPEIAPTAFESQQIRDVDLHTKATKAQAQAAQDFFESIGQYPFVWRAQNPDVEYAEPRSMEFDYATRYITGYNGNRTHIRPQDMQDGLEVAGLADGAFRGDTRVLYFAVPYNDAFYYIGSEAFMDSVLETVDLFDSVTTIGDDAFNGSRLKTLTLPGSVTYVGERAFANCAELREITVLCDPEILPANAFEGCGALIRVCSENGEDRALAERLGIPMPYDPMNDPPVTEPPT